MNQYSCSFYLLIESETLAECKDTVESISAFIANSSVVWSEHSEMLCVSGRAEAGGQPPSILDNPSLRILSPSEWNLPGETDPYFGPEIVRYFGIASRRSKGELIVVVEPRMTIQDGRSLEDAIQSVASDRRLLVVSHNLDVTSLPTSAILAASATMGSTTGAASWYGVEVKKRLLGGVVYRFCQKEMTTDVPWLIGAIAAEFQRDKQGTGRKVKVSYWM